MPPVNLISRPNEGLIMTWNAPPLTLDAWSNATFKITNPSQAAYQDVQLTIKAPWGLEVDPSKLRRAKLSPGASEVVDIRLKPTSCDELELEFEVELHYFQANSAQSVCHRLKVMIKPPDQPPTQTKLTTDAVRSSDNRIVTSSSARPPLSRPHDNFRYDAFISYSSQDRDWVEKRLLLNLENAGLRICIDFRDFEIGVPSLVNMENAVENSRKTLLVLTPAWIDSEWTQFENLLIQTNDPIGRGRRMLRLLVKPCSLPSRLRIFTYLDLTDSRQLDVQLPRLIEALLSAEQKSQVDTKRDLPPTPAPRGGADVPVDARRKLDVMDSFDIFLAHNSLDQAAVVAVADELERRGFRPWLAQRQIPPGRWIQDVIQEVIPKVKCAGICIGFQGLGKVEEVELKAFMRQCIENKIPVIPILLPGVREIPKNLLFLMELRWVRFDHIKDKQAFDELEWGIREASDARGPEEAMDT